MAFQTPKLLKKTEEAILTFLKDDIEHTLPLIKRLEEVSFQLWTENNTKFLFDDGVGMEEDDEQWFWDEEVFYDQSSSIVPDTPYTPYQEKVTYISDEDSNYSSYVESSTQSTCKSPCSSTGYRGSCESSLSASTLYTKSPKSADDWIIISTEVSCKEDSDWLLVSPRTIEEARQFECANVSRTPSFQTTDNWTILSVHVNSRKWDCNSGAETPQTRNTPSSGIRRQLFQSPKGELCDSSSTGTNISFTNVLDDSAASTDSTADSIMRTVGSENDDWFIIHSYNADSPTTSFDNRFQDKGQISPWNVPKFATVT